MGADSFIVYFGLRYEVDSDAELERLEGRTDPRLVAARGAQLRFYVGRPTEGEPYFLLIGTEIGQFGIQGKTRAELAEEELARFIKETKEKLISAGLGGEPKFHFQLEAQY